MKVLLTTLNAKYIHLNLAIRLLYELNKKHEGLRWKEFTIKENKDDIADYCKDYDVVAFSCYIWNITQTLEVTQKIKALSPHTKILLGGPEVSYEWEQLIARDDIDYIITGEGEIPFQQFLQYYPNIDLVPNLAHKNDKKEVLYHQQNVTFDLQKYYGINPYINDSPEELYNKVCYIETSRGCPYKCEFCLASLDNKVRYLPTETIKEHLLYLMQHGRVIKFLDRTFNVKRDFTIDIFKFILEHHRPENVFQFEITADILHPDIVQFIKDYVPKGLFRFEIGIQTVNQKANLEVSRKQNFDKTKYIIQALEHKIEMHLDLIVGLALDYWEDIRYSFEEVFKLHPPELQLGFLKFLKGTPVRYKTEQHGFVYDPMPPYQIIESNYLSKAELHQITILENALEIYWNKKRAINTLKYVTEKYSSFDFMLGLGNSFLKQREFHKYALDDVYVILHSYIQENYPDDKLLLQMMAVDYYLQSNVRPKVQFYEEIERSEKSSLIERLGLNHHKYRYIVLQLDFDYNEFVQSKKIVETNHRMIIQYTGVSKPEVVEEKQEQVIS